MKLAEFIYTVILRPKALKSLANAAICKLIPGQLDLDGAIVVLNPRDPVVSGALALGLYEKAEASFFRTVCKPGMTFLDIGANIGYYTALALRVIGSGKIIALEPDPENFGFLQQTVAANRSAFVHCVNKAAGAANGRLTLYTSSANRGDNRLYSNDLCEGQVDVEVCTVDSLLSSLNVESVDLIKIDVQGFEGHVFRGMRDTLLRSRNLILLSEFWPFGLESAGTPPLDVLCELEAAGLLLHELTPQGTLTPIADKTKFIERFPDRHYTNIVGLRTQAVS
ncbi:MAG: FkbM family methyltransferase [Bryobacteraceae bacterium]